jgi:hypothetical protein
VTQQDYQRKYLHMVDVVRRMRGWQRERDHVRYLPRDDHARMKHLEREVDKIIKEEMKRQKSNQKELF